MKEFRQSAQSSSIILRYLFIILTEYRILSVEGCTIHLTLLLVHDPEVRMLWLYHIPDGLFLYITSRSISELHITESRSFDAQIKAVESGWGRSGAMT